MRHYAVCANDSPVTNGNARHHADVVAQPNVVADDNGAFAVEWPMGRWLLHLLACSHAVRVVGYEHVGSCQQVVADGDAVDGSDMGVFSYGTAVAYNDGGCRMVAVMRVPGS